MGAQKRLRRESTTRLNDADSHFATYPAALNDSVPQRGNKLSCYSASFKNRLNDVAPDDAIARRQVVNSPERH
jgi:hypothetical protein